MLIFHLQISNSISLSFYNSDSAPTQFNPSWNSKLPSSRSLAQLSIPGTHHSGSSNCQSFCWFIQCQSWSVGDQLAAGIRYLDLRVSEEGLKLGHGPFQFGSLKDVLYTIAFFLYNYDSEFIILHFQRQTGTQDLAHSLLLLLQQVLPSRLFLSQKIPKVGEVRGKAWIWGSWGCNFKWITMNVFGTEGSVIKFHYRLQNYFTVYFWTIDHKVLHVKSLAEAKCGDHFMKLNFLSGSWGVLFPFLLARWREGPNEKMLQERGGCLGVSVMDFPGEGVVDKIIESNFKSSHNS